MIKAQQVSNVGKEVINCCMHTTTSNLHDPEEKSKYTESLAHLTNCANVQFPEFTALKFYRVDYTAIFIILNMMTSYIVVLVQFRKESD